MHKEKVKISFATVHKVKVEARHFWSIFAGKMYIAGTENQPEFGQSI